MAAIVRVKRRINDDPADSLVLSCKRPRKGSDSEASGNNDSEEVKNLFKFAGTVKAEDDCVSRAVRDAIKKEKLEKEYKLHSVDPGAITSRLRARTQAGHQAGRYKVISQRRALQLEDLDREDKENDSGNKDRDEKLPFKIDDNKENEDSTTTELEAQKLYLLWDVEHEEKKEKLQKAIERPKHNNESTITCNDVPLEREVRPPAAPGEDQYVYDLYYMNKRDVDLRLMENLLAIEAYQDEVHFDRFRNPEEQEVYDDEDDSNDESNWRNDYPDEDPKFFENQDAEYSIGEQELVRGFGLDDDDELGTMIAHGLNLGGGAFGQELSSEEDEDKEPAYDFSQPLVDTGIWSTASASANIWGSTMGSGMGTSDSVADDWVSKSLEANFDPDSGIWGSSMGSSMGPSMGVGMGVANPWSTPSVGGTGPPANVTSSSEAEMASSSGLWAPSTDFDQYKARILRELGDDDEENTDLT